MATTVEKQTLVETKTVTKHDDDFTTFKLPVMTKQELKQSALEHGGYSTPSLNDQLYLHYKGYCKIENLEEYVNLKALWLDSNGLQTIENIGHLTSLRCLFLQRNLFTKIDNLHGLNTLVQLDLSENRITSIEGLSCLPMLSTLNIAKNALSDAMGICHLKECKKLSSIDFSNNSLRGEEVIGVLASIPSLLSLNMTGNPVVSEVPNFRKRLVSSVKALKYLDRPIFDMERQSTEAWAVGGRTAELAMKKRLQKQKQDEERAAMQNFRQWKEVARVKAKEEKENMTLNGPTTKQVADMESNQQKKKAREEAAAIEAAREREIYRIDPVTNESDSNKGLIQDEKEVSNENEIFSHHEKTSKKETEKVSPNPKSDEHELTEIAVHLEKSQDLDNCSTNQDEKKPSREEFSTLEHECESTPPNESETGETSLDEGNLESKHEPSNHIRPLQSYQAPDEHRRASYQGENNFIIIH